jgi:hypothetical protein
MLIENGPPQAIKVKFDLQQISLQDEGQPEDITGFLKQSCHCYERAALQKYPNGKTALASQGAQFLPTPCTSFGKPITCHLMPRQ